MHKVEDLNTASKRNNRHCSKKTLRKQTNEHIYDKSKIEETDLIKRFDQSQFEDSA